MRQAVATLVAIADERERLERQAVEAEALRRADAMKTSVIQSVSHDLRTPLATIEAALDGLQSPSIELGASERAELLLSVRLELERLKRFVENMTTSIARERIGRKKPLEPVSARQRIRSLASQSRRPTQSPRSLRHDWARPTRQRTAHGLKPKRMKGLEPSTFCMASRRSSQLSYIRAAPNYSGGPLSRVRRVPRTMREAIPLRPTDTSVISSRDAAPIRGSHPQRPRPGPGGSDGAGAEPVRRLTGRTECQSGIAPCDVTLRPAPMLSQWTLGR